LAGPTYTFFFYGTLMDRAVLNLVSGREFTVVQLRPAILKGYRRLCVSNAVYPGIVPVKGSDVAGVVVRGITPAVATRLDAFENDGYDRTNVTVQTYAGRRVKAAAYVATDRMSLDEVEWKFNAWLKQHRRHYLGRVRMWAKAYAG